MSMRSLYAFLIPALLGVACSGNKTTQDESAVVNVEEEVNDSIPATGFSNENWDSFEDIRNYLVVGSLSEDSIQAIEKTSGILVYPSEKRLNEFYLSTGDGEDYSIAMNGNIASMKRVAKLFSAIGIDTLRPSKRYLKLVGKTKTWIIDTQKPNATLWYSIGFKAGKVPQIKMSGMLDSLTARQYFY